MPRKPLNPTQEQRSLVKWLAANGHPQEKIADVLKIRSVKTLRRHFRDELDTGAAKLQVNMTIFLTKAAANGNVNAAKYLHGHATRILERDSHTVTSSPPPFIVACEEAPAEEEPPTNEDDSKD